MKNNKKCKLIIFSDVHYATERPVNNGSKIDRKLTHYAIPLLNKLIDKINDIKPDLVVNLGDLIEDSGNKETDIKDLKIIWQLLKRVNAPFYSLIGNHELRSMNSRKEIEEVMGYDNATFSIDFNGYHFVFISPEVNNEIGSAHGGILRTQYFSDKDLEWLKKDLEDNTLPCVLFSHFGLAEDDMKGNWWFDNGVHVNHAFWANRDEIKNILRKDSNLLGVFSGHQHWTKDLKEDGIPYYVIGSLTEDIDSNGIPDGIYFEVELDGDKLLVNKHNIEL